VLRIAMRTAITRRSLHSWFGSLREPPPDWEVLLLSVGCHENRNSAADSYAPPHDTNVGPIPGDVSVVHTEPDPFLRDPVALQEGRRLFGWYNCSGCHGSYGGGGTGPSLRDATWIYGNRSDQIFNTLVYGRSKGMAAWAEKIPADQMWKIVAYLKSLNTPLEPEAPSPHVEEEVPSSDIYFPGGQDTHSH
jgi:hypothetical protein